MSSSNFLAFQRSDSVVGVGFEIEYGGVKQYSIAWPDRPPERYTKEYAEQNAVRVIGETEISFSTFDPPEVSGESAPVDGETTGKETTSASVPQDSTTVAQPVASEVPAPLVAQPTVPTAAPTAQSEAPPVLASPASPTTDGGTSPDLTTV